MQPRPGTAVTEDGRRLAQVTSYTGRRSGLSPKQQALWDTHADRWWIPDPVADTGPLELDRWFGRSAPLVVEIGSGAGEATAALAAGRPDLNVLAFEVWRPGIAATFGRLERAGVHNVRLMSVDAAWAMTHLLGPESIHELWTFFPDPWPKTRHHRRRLVAPAFADAAASRLEHGGLWRLATDWPAYAEQIVEVLEAQVLLENAYDGRAPRWDDRPVTRFERRGSTAGRPIADLVYRRVGRVTGAAEDSGQPRFDLAARSLPR